MISFEHLGSRIHLEPVFVYIFYSIKNPLKYREDTYQPRTR